MDEKPKGRHCFPRGYRNPRTKLVDERVRAQLVEDLPFIGKPLAAYEYARSVPYSDPHKRVTLGYLAKKYGFTPAYIGQLNKRRVDEHMKSFGVHPDVES